MNFNTQNGRIEALKDTWMIVGVDVGSQKHFARAFTNRKVELTRKAFEFRNSAEGFQEFSGWIGKMMALHQKDHVMVGMEPTGHYWVNLGRYVRTHGMMLSHVNPAHVKKSKELDDTNPSKNDKKDPKTIAGLVNDGRYALPYMPEGIFAEIRTLNNMRDQAVEEATRAKNRYARWMCIYFPESGTAYTDQLSKGLRLVLEKAPLPSDIVALGAEGVNQIWRDNKLRASGMTKAQKLVEAAQNSIGSREGLTAARLEIKQILEDLDRFCGREEELTALLEKTVAEVPNANLLMTIDGIGPKTMCAFVAEVGDISRFDNAKEIQKLSGLAIVNDQSGKHNGEYKISYRGRKKLRKTLYLGGLSVIGHNKYLAELYEYFTTRKVNPLRKMQAVIAISCKLIRVFFAMLTKGVAFDGERMISDIIRPEVMPA